LSNFTDDLIFNQLKNILKSDIIQKSDFNQVIQYVSKMPRTSEEIREIFILTRAENFDENYTILSSPASLDQLIANYEIFLEMLRVAAENLEASIYLSELFEVGPRGLFENTHERREIPLRYKTRNILLKFLENNTNFDYFELDGIIRFNGVRSGWNKTQDLLYRQPFSKEISDLIVNQIVLYSNANLESDIKVIATDADNSLWGGVVGEDALNSIQIGKEYPGRVFEQYQYFLKEKKNQGLLLALVTKNNLEDVVNTFKSLPEMPLKIDDFASIEANWNPKSESLISIAKKLNIGMDSILFIDDSSFEISTVNNSLPEVKTLLLDSNLENRELQLVGLPYRWSTGGTNEDLNRTRMIKENIERDEHLSKLGIQEAIRESKFELTISTVADSDSSDFQRVAQLFNKTNQFNMTTERYSERDLEKILAKGFVYTAKLKDRFGDYGLIGAILALTKDDQVTEIRNAVMSCRALGRGIEDQFFSTVFDILGTKGVTKIECWWRESPKNGQTENFYSKFGFASKVSTDGLIFFGDLSSVIDLKSSLILTRNLT